MPPRLFISRIEGLSLLDPVSDPRNCRVQILVQVRTPEGPQERHLEVPLLDALYLLNMLEALSADQGLDHLRKPPDGQPQ